MLLELETAFLLAVLILIAWADIPKLQCDSLPPKLIISHKS
jgi:hypothetical protein